MRASQLPAAGRASRGASAWLGLRTAATDPLERAATSARGSERETTATRRLYRATKATHRLERATKATRGAAPDPEPALVLGRYRPCAASLGGDDRRDPR